MDAFLNALADEPFRMGVTFAVLFSALFIFGAFLLNKRYGWWVSAELLSVEKSRAAEARADAAQAKTDTKAEADEKVTSMRAAMERRIQELREDGASRVAQVRADSQAELDRLLKLIDALQREIESWRQAFHLADQANREEDDARWDRIEASLATTKQFILGVQRQFSIRPPELESRGDERGATDVV